MAATNPLDAKVADLNRITLGATNAEFQQALGRVKDYLDAVRAAVEHGRAQDLPGTMGDANFLVAARVIAEQMVPTMRRVAADNRKKLA